MQKQNRKRHRPREALLYEWMQHRPKVAKSTADAWEKLETHSNQNLENMVEIGSTQFDPMSDEYDPPYSSS